MTTDTPRHDLVPDDLVDRFVAEGCVRLDDVFPRSVADECRAILWRSLDASPDDPSTWTRPVVRVPGRADAPFRAAATAAPLSAAYDTLVGTGAWQPMLGIGTFPIRFPSTEDPGDCGWHLDAGFGWETEADFLRWRINGASRGRALLVLMLFSDVGERDAPTRIRAGSHVTMARALAPYGDAGATLGELAANEFAETAHHREVQATGRAGTVYLCHPFLVHAAQPHRGSTPRFMAQPPLLPSDPAGPPVDSIVMRAVEPSG